MTFTWYLLQLMTFMRGVLPSPSLTLISPLCKASLHRSSSPLWAKMCSIDWLDLSKSTFDEKLELSKINLSNNFDSLWFRHSSRHEFPAGFCCENISLESSSLSKMVLKFWRSPFANKWWTMFFPDLQLKLKSKSFASERNRMKIIFLPPKRIWIYFTFHSFVCQDFGNCWRVASNGTTK